MALALLDLIRPQFLIGFRLPDEVHDVVSLLRVAELDRAWDETGVTHWGKATFEGKGDASPVPVQRTASGELFEWGDVNVEFRLTIPRFGAPDLKGVIDTAAGVTGTTSPIGKLKATLDRFGAAPATAVVSDYPGFAFRLELLLSAITLHLPKKVFVPARLAPDGWLDQGGGRSVRYVLKKLELSPPPPASPYGKPPATWRAESDAIQGQDTAVDLALFSWEPVSHPRASLRSIELTDRVGTRWGGVCDLPAPPARVLWTFNRQPLGLRSGGWPLDGFALPDPPGTRRSAPPDKALLVRAPAFDPEQAAEVADGGGGNLEPARIVGFDARPGAEAYNFVSQVSGRALQLPFLHVQFDPPVLTPPKIVANGGLAFGADGHANDNGNGNGDAAMAVSLAPAPAGTPAPLRGQAADLTSQRVTVECGPVEQARLLLFRDQSVPAGQIVIRAFGATNNLLKTDTEATLPTTGASNINSLPAEWRNVQDVEDLMGFLFKMQNRPGTFGIVGRLITYAPPAGTVRFEIVGNVPVGRPVPNDRSAIQLMEAYGKSLRAVVRQANGPTRRRSRPSERRSCSPSRPAS